MIGILDKKQGLTIYSYTTPGINTAMGYNLRNAVAGVYPAQTITTPMLW